MKVQTLPCFAYLLAIALSFLPCVIFAQESENADTYLSFPDKLFSSIERKSNKLQEHLNLTTTKYLSRLARREERLKRKLARKDPEAAARIFGNVNGRYDSLTNKLSAKTEKFRNFYDPHLDSMSTTLNFLKQNNAVVNSASISKINSSLSEYSDIQQQLNRVNFIQESLKSRQTYLQEQLSNFGLAKEFKKYQGTLYYYRAQAQEYRNIFNEPKKLEAALLKAANKIPTFRNFFNKHSQLASLFRLPVTDEPSFADLPGLQTRAMVMQNLDERLGSGPNVNQMMGSSIQAAQSGLDGAKKKINQLGNNGADLDMPDFKPNTEKSKSFLRRLELGSNIQSVKSNTFFPVTSDIGLSLGYKFSQKAVAGVGASYKLGWGRDIRHISISHEGVGLRTFLDVKIKSSFWLSGGGEMNYRTRINDFEQLKNQSDWQKSALLGVSKKYKLSGKFQGNMQVLYDFLHRQNVPASSPLIVRFGYHLK